MNNVQVLDCTLRDGGYCNQWNFGYENTKKIIRGLVDANVEIIECGFITSCVDYSKDITKYTKIEQISEFVTNKKSNQIFVAMINYGEYDLNNVPDRKEEYIDGIRVAFHKKDMIDAIKYCDGLKKKGYMVFVQPMVSSGYSDLEFITLIGLVNEIVPYAFYIVDSFGNMKSKDLNRLFSIVEHNLLSGICIGFHSHNNLQLAYSNAITLIEKRTNRNLIVDCSIYGMGRGAGNLNTELFVDYLIQNYKKDYKIKPLLTVIDGVLDGFFQQNRWGYSLPNYISALHNVHPNYAGFLDDKKTLTIDEMNEIFESMDDSKKYNFDKAYIEKLYMEYMNKGKIHMNRNDELKKALFGQKVILIAPGKNAVKYKDLIIDTINGQDCVVISINYQYPYYPVDYIFMSNIRRFKELTDEQLKKCIVTTNISNTSVYLKTSYKDLLSNVEMVQDNAGLMAIKYLINNGVEKIYLAGFDGYTHDSKENYALDKMTIITRDSILKSINIGMKKVISEYSKIVEIEFITPSRYK